MQIKFLFNTLVIGTYWHIFHILVLQTNFPVKSKPQNTCPNDIIKKKIRKKSFLMHVIYFSIKWNLKILFFLTLCNNFAISSSRNIANTQTNIKNVINERNEIVFFSVFMGCLCWCILKRFSTRLTHKLLC